MNRRFQVILADRDDLEVYITKEFEGDNLVLDDKWVIISQEIKDRITPQIIIALPIDMIHSIKEII